MAKTRIILFFILILYSFEQSNNNYYSSMCETSTNPSSDKYDCIDRGDDDFDELGNHCCHRTNVYTDGTTKYECEFFTENDDYGDMNAYIESEKKQNANFKEIRIDCFQKYMNYNLVLLIAFLFIIHYF